MGALFSAINSKINSKILYKIRIQEVFKISIIIEIKNVSHSLQFKIVQYAASRIEKIFRVHCEKKKTDKMKKHNSILCAQAHNEGYYATSDNACRRTKPRQSRGAISSASILIESRNYPNCVHFLKFFLEDLVTGVSHRKI